jgi:cbb3-type cytochrome oxidase subunit 3
MNNKFLWIILLVIALISVSAYLYNKEKQKILDQERDQAITNEIQRPSITLNAKHQFKNGRHVFVGSVELPNPCNKITTDVIKESNETVISVDYVSNEQICAEVITEKEFRISFEGTADETIIAKLNGELVNLNLFEIPLDKNIDEVEIYNKG